jgi:hypothetical protein
VASASRDLALRCRGPCARSSGTGTTEQFSRRIDDGDGFDFDDVRFGGRPFDDFGFLHLGRHLELHHFRRFAWRCPARYERRSLKHPKAAPPIALDPDEPVTPACPKQVEKASEPVTPLVETAGSKDLFHIP